MTEHFNHWMDLIDSHRISPTRRRAALAMYLQQIDGYSISDAVQYVYRLDDEAVRVELLENQVHRYLTRLKKS